MSEADALAIDVWLAPEPTALSEEQARTWAALLSPDERERWGRFMWAEDRQRFLFARVLTRSVLGRHLGRSPAELSFSRNAYGKPGLEEGGELRFNLSHTRGMVALALCRGAELGVDVEAITRRVELESLATRYFSSPECQALRMLDGERKREHFFALWTLKEAWVKAKGLGLRVPLDAFDFTLDERATTLHCDASLGERAENWSFWRHAQGEHRIAVAVENPGGRPLQVTLRDIQLP